MIPVLATMNPMRDTDPDSKPDLLSDLDARRRRAYYRAGHRGTKELDWLLGRFAKAELENMDAGQLNDFEAFLASPDPDIEDWLLTPGFAAPEGVAGEFVARLKRFHDL